MKFLEAGGGPSWSVKCLGVGKGPLWSVKVPRGGWESLVECEMPGCLCPITEYEVLEGRLGSRAE